MTSRALLGAYRKGYAAGKAGKKRAAPYADHRTSHHNGKTFSQSFINYWNLGFDDAVSGKPERYATREASDAAV